MEVRISLFAAAGRGQRAYKSGNYYFVRHVIPCKFSRTDPILVNIKKNLIMIKIFAIFIVLPFASFSSLHTLSNPLG
jgi:hypothetical protein